MQTTMFNSAFLRTGLKAYSGVKCEYQLKYEHFKSLSCDKLKFTTLHDILT